MPVEYLPEQDQLEFPRYYAWSWPDHPSGMSDTDARLRVFRASAEPFSSGVRTNEVTSDLASAYGDLLVDGRASLQRVRASGDSLPRNEYGMPLSLPQQIGADVAERNQSWGPTVYRSLTAEQNDLGARVPTVWGAADSAGAAVWLPVDGKSSDAFAAGRVDMMPDRGRSLIEVVGHVHLTHEERDLAWPEAVDRGRNLGGNTDALVAAARRCPDDVVVVDDRAAPECLVVESPRGGVDVAFSVRHDSLALERSDELYAAVRGTMVMEYGSPLNESGRALDALTASLVTARGTNGVGAGWNPPEPELLREAGRELQRNPDRLKDVLECAHEIEQIVYPPWPGRDHLLERDPEPERVEDERDAPPAPPRDVFDGVRLNDRRVMDDFRDRPLPGVGRLPPSGLPGPLPSAPVRPPVRPDPLGPELDRDGVDPAVRRDADPELPSSGPERAPEPAGTPDRSAPERERGGGLSR